MTARVPTTEELLVEPQFFGLTTATPLQRAICRIADGLPLGDLACDPVVVRALGGAEAIAALPLGTIPTELDIYSGIRTGKSLFSSVLAFHATQAVDVSSLRPGEVPRVSVTCLDLDKSRVVLEHLIGTIEAKPALRSRLVGSPTSDSLLVRHPSGRAVEIKVVAGARAGGQLVARWSAGAIFDEKPRMMSAEDGSVVNYEDAAEAVQGRLLPGAQVVGIGSPFAPWGAAYVDVQEHWGRPSRHKVVIKAPAFDLNPQWWTPARCEDLREANPRAYKVNVLAEFADAEVTVFDEETVARMLAPREMVMHEWCSEPFGAIDVSDGGGDSFTRCCWRFMRVSPAIAMKQMHVFKQVWDPQRQKFIEQRQVDEYDNPRTNPDFQGVDPAPILVIKYIEGLEGRFRQNLTADDVYGGLAAYFQEKNVRLVTGDQRGEFHVVNHLRHHGIHFESIAWTNARKARAVDWLLAMARDGRLWIPDHHERMLAELRQFQMTIVRGSSTIKFAGKKKDDYPALLLAIATHCIEAQLATPKTRSTRTAAELYRGE